MENKHKKVLPPVPTKRYFAIGEVSTLCDLKPHVLRYWEQEFPQLQPAKRRGNRRYYQQAEILLIRKIRELLYFEGFTIQGAKAKLSDRKFVKDATSEEAIQKAQAELPLNTNTSATIVTENLSNFKSQLHDILKILK
ncbi:MAG: MerR family transcriptional regulator [Proteobacteria bacterium]|nr:MerR family transcriptional regulator [Pseudomonadota bacterium]MDA0872201.1 MerR family transcriptional regulator [Pseudomonadota bacterium]MDA1134388.1 MerR family transcriptional regulator [Pseudomonadota bacterium]